MENSKDYFVANIVTNEAMQCNGYMDFLLHGMKEQIANGILAIVSDGNEYAIKMLPEQRIEKPDMLSIEIRQGISVQELVRCRECKYFEDGDCKNFDKRELGWDDFDRSVSKDWFCADGKRKDGADDGRTD